MNIIVLTSSMANDDFNDYAAKARIKPNPSNQNFYNKLIRALEVNNNVAVLSLRPFVKGMFEEQIIEEATTLDGTIKYYYPYLENSTSYKLFKQTKAILDTIDKIVEENHFDHFMLVVDVLRYPFLKSLAAIDKKYMPLKIAVITDNPANLSRVNATYVSQVKKHVKKFDAYITLTESLNRIFNINKKPSYIVEGIVEEIPPRKKLPIGDYIFFGGALYERYGVKSLVDSFHKSSCPFKLVIAGHGDLSKYIYDISKKDHRILFLGLVDKETLYTLEQHAHMNINPRPFEWKLDRESVPSKLLEYLSSGAPTMSTKHTRLMELFPNNLYWIDGHEKLEESLEKISSIDPAELRKKASNARLRIYELYGLRTQGEKIGQFLNSVNVSLIK